MASPAVKSGSPAPGVSLSPSQLTDISRALQQLQSQFTQLTDTLSTLSSTFASLHPYRPPPDTQPDSPSPPLPTADDDDDLFPPPHSPHAPSHPLPAALDDSEEKRFERPSPLIVDRSHTSLYTLPSKPVTVWRKAGQPAPSPSTATASLSPTQAPGKGREAAGTSFSPVSPPLTSSIVALPPLNGGLHLRGALPFPFASPSHRSRSPQLSARRRKSAGSEDADDEEKRAAYPTPAPAPAPKRATTPLPSPSAPPLAAADRRPTPLDDIADEESRPRATSSPHPHPFPSSTPTSPAAKHIFLSHPNKVKLNVGGTVFHTTLSTLCSPGGQQSMLGSMFSGGFALEVDSRGAYFLDRDPGLFRHILNWLRDGSLPLATMSWHTKQALLRESRYFGLQPLTAALHAETREMKAKQRRELSQEKEYKLCTVDEREMSALFQKMTMMEGYDFEDWIRGGVGSGAGEGKGRGGSLGSLAGVGRGEGSGGSNRDVHVLFSKKLSRGELMLLDRLQTGM